jgi:hypothetical protein
MMATRMKKTAFSFIGLTEMRNHTYAVYNSIGQFQARFTSYARAVRWAIREGMEWTAEIRKEVQ